MDNAEMKILMATAEIAPFSKAGGLGDVLGALPKALREEGADVRIITPLYGSIDRDKFWISPMEHWGDFPIQIGDKLLNVRFYWANIPYTDIKVYFVESEEMFSRWGIYNDPASGEGYWDNPTRFILFCKAVLAFLNTEVFQPQIIHLNDSHTALIAPMLRDRNNYGRFDSIHPVLTIHNIEHQGRYHQHYVYEAGLDTYQTYHGGPFEFWGDFNFLKAGIVYSDLITTVSETYANETRSDYYFGHGLESILAVRGGQYVGVLNGVDYSEWNPETDAFIAQNYNKESIDRKEENKRSLFQECGFNDAETDKPLLSIITRFADQKGVDILLGALDEIMGEDLFFVLLGTGKHDYEDAFRMAEERYQGRLRAFITFDNALAHRIEAGSDLYLMPSRFEPCGLNQLYSMKYGTLPVVRRTGGLADTVENYHPETNEGTGFVFDDYTSEALANTCQWAITTYRDDPSAFKKLRYNAMSKDFSWTKSAKKYLELYRNVLHVD